MPRITPVLTLMIAVLLGACGQKGDLYLPVEQPEQRDRGAQSPGQS